MVNLIPQSDTRITPLAGMDGGRFVATRYANLVRDRFSGVFHARAKVGGKLVRRSLRTKSVEVAKRALDGLLAEERARRNVQAPDVDGWKLGPLADLWLRKVEAEPDKAPRAVDYRRETLQMLRK